MFNVPITARLLSRTGSLNITNRILDDVQYSNAAPGGYTTATLKLSRPLDRSAIELAPFNTLEIVDATSNEQLWFGRLEDPGKSSRDQVWSLAATGWGAHLQDETKPVAYVDGRMDDLLPFQPEVRGPGDVQTGPLTALSTPMPESAMTFLFTQRGAQLATGRIVSMQRHTFVQSGQHIGLFGVFAQAGVAGGGNYFFDLVGRGGSSVDAQLFAWTPTVAGAVIQLTIGTHFTSLHTIPELRMRWAGALTTIGSDTIWVRITDLTMIATRVDRFGNELVSSASYNVAGVLPHEVIEDVIGRFLPSIDGAVSVIDTSLTTRLTQLSYEDATTAQAIFDDLMTLFPTHFWAVWGGDPIAAYRLPGYGSAPMPAVPGAAGARLEWQPWPTVVALEGLDSRLDDFDDSGSSADLYNAVTVRYKDAAGRSSTVNRTSDSPPLTTAGLTRRAFLDLGSQLGNAAQATVAGDNFLAAHKYPSNGGTIKVRRPLRDVVTGRLLKPRELRSGVLCRVANLAPQPDDFNVAASNGSTVFRVSNVSYSAKSDEATLTLDSYSRSVARQLAGLQRQVKRTRRL